MPARAASSASGISRVQGRDQVQTVDMNSRPDLIAHADWSKDPKKRWVATAKWSRKRRRFEADAPRLVGSTMTFLQSLRTEAAGGTVLVGFDVRSGYPAHTRERPVYRRSVRCSPNSGANLPGLASSRWPEAPPKSHDMRRSIRWPRAERGESGWFRPWNSNPRGACIANASAKPCRAWTGTCPHRRAESPHRNPEPWPAPSSGPSVPTRSARPPSPVGGRYFSRHYSGTTVVKSVCGLLMVRSKSFSKPAKS